MPPWLYAEAWYIDIVEYQVSRRVVRRQSVGGRLSFQRKSCGWRRVIDGTFSSVFGNQLVVGSVR
jgi:hypothetical protein